MKRKEIFKPKMNPEPANNEKYNQINQFSESQIDILHKKLQKRWKIEKYVFICFLAGIIGFLSFILVCIAFVFEYDRFGSYDVFITKDVDLPTIIDFLSFQIKHENDEITYIALIGGILAIIGPLLTSILAIYWLISFKNVFDEFYKAWLRNPSFIGSYPFQPAFYDLLTRDEDYQAKLRSSNKLKSILMIILGIPIIGSFFIYILSSYSLFVIPIILYSYLKRPNRHVSRYNLVYTQPQQVEPLSTNTIVTQVSEPFFCQVCESSRPATAQRMKCDSCNRFVCLDCFKQMAAVGKTNCPMCRGRVFSQ